MTLACLSISVCFTLPLCEFCLEFFWVIALTDSLVCVDIRPHHISEIPNSFLTYYR